MPLIPPEVVLCKPEDHVDRGATCITRAGSLCIRQDNVMGDMVGAAGIVGTRIPDPR